MTQRRKKPPLKRAALAGTALLAAAALWQGLTVRKYVLETDKLTAPVRLALLSDFHGAQYGQGQSRLLAAVELGVLAGFAIAPHCIRGWMRKAPGAVTYAVLGMMLSSLYAIVVGPTTLKVPQHVMTLSDFHILWFVLGIAVMLGLEALKRRVQKALAH